MRLRVRLYLAFGLIIAIVLAPAIYGLSRLSELRDIAFDLKTRHASSFLTLGRIQTSIAELNRLQRTYVAAPASDTREAVFRVMERTDQQLHRLSVDGYAEADEMRATLREATVRVDSLIQAGSVDEATRYFQEVKPVFAAAAEALDALAEAIDRRGTAEASRAQRISSTVARTTGIALGIAVAIALLVGALAAGALAAPLRRLRAAMATVAGGQFVPPTDLPYDRSDEVGDLCRSFRSMAQRLAELDRVKAEFVSIASHELKTPVSVIEGYAEMLEDGLYGEVAERQEEILGYIREQTHVLTERVNQLLSLSRFEAGALEVNLTDVRLRDILEDVEHSFSALAAQKEVELSVRADETAPEWVEVDPDRVRSELLGNVLSNAVKFTPPGGSVRLLARGSGEDVVFQVKDTGGGIPPAQLPYIFEKYYQAGHHAGKVGTGLGLAIAREIAEAHGGTIGARSEPGSGTTFEVRLPVRSAGLGQVEEPGSASAQPVRPVAAAASAGEETPAS